MLVVACKFVYNQSLPKPITTRGTHTQSMKPKGVGEEPTEQIFWKRKPSATEKHTYSSGSSIGSYEAHTSEMVERSLGIQNPAT